MKINSNITAYITNNSYSQNETRLANSTARLSSGFKLNKSGDDPANFAIASKMRSMIKGLEKVKTNTTTGVSVIQTAEAAMQETQDMIQRMNELSIKASNGTMSSSDRANVQDEVDQLLKEINRIAETTEFNGMKLLNGTFNDRGYTSNLGISVMDYNEKTISGKYLIDISKDANGNYVVQNSGSTLPAGYGQATDLLGNLTDAIINSETVKNDDGTYTDYVKVKGANGAEIRLKAQEGTPGVPDTALELDLTGRGSMRLQVGTEEGEVISASIPLMTTEAMGLARVDMLTKEGANKAIDQMNEALAYVSSARSRMGAYENRLENTEEYLNAYNEDINTSLSRIQDTDMAEEMTEFTSMQILTQAGISMLAQANEAPQQALQLLQ